MCVFERGERHNTCLREKEKRENVCIREESDRISMFERVKERREREILCKCITARASERDNDMCVGERESGRLPRRL